MRLALKIAVVAVMTLAILIPLTMIRGVIHDRERYRAQAVADVGRSYGGAQAFAGPVLMVPYTEVVEIEQPDQYNIVHKVRRAETRHWTFFPTSLDVRGPMRPGTRKRGLHEVLVYEWQGVATARFEAKIPDDGGATRQIGKPYLSYAIADVRGLRTSPRLRVNGRDIALEEGVGSRAGSGLHIRLDAPTPGQTMALDTRLDLVLGGTESLALVPLGKSNRFSLDAAWPHPSFTGISPRYDMDGTGFRADWEIASVATRAQEQFRSGVPLPKLAGAADGIEAVGVSLIDPVDIYTQADRATKYGLLFVMLTFVGFFLFELIRQLPIHPIQYGLVGLALAIFFLLLVSLSEHIDFLYAYLAASVACVGLLGFYLSAVLRSTARGLGFAAMLATLYAALYGLLVSEQNALVMGAGLLFMVLATVMVVTRKVDWYQMAGARPAARLP